MEEIAGVMPRLTIVFMKMNRRPIIRYFGGKWNSAPWIISHFPEHTIYVEPYGGAASVLLRKPRSKSEVYNDLDGNLVLMFRMLQNKSATRDLLRALKWTPYARQEKEDAYEASDNEIETVRRFIVRSWMDINNGKRSSGFRVCVASTIGTPPEHSWISYVRQFYSFADRFRGVIIENLPALELIQKYDRPHTFFYADPPYVSSTRSQTNEYYREMTDQDHRQLAACLLSAHGKVLLSGYTSDLYAELYPDWEMSHNPARVNGSKSKVETLWKNY